MLSLARGACANQMPYAPEWLAQQEEAYHAADGRLEVAIKNPEFMLRDVRKDDSSLTVSSVTGKGLLNNPEF